MEKFDAVFRKVAEAQSLDEPITGISFAKGCFNLVAMHGNKTVKQWMINPGRAYDNVELWHEADAPELGCLYNKDMAVYLGLNNNIMMSQVGVDGWTVFLPDCGGVVNAIVMGPPFKISTIDTFIVTSVEESLMFWSRRGNCMPIGSYVTGGKRYCGTVITSLIFTPPRYIVCGSVDGILMVWDLSTECLTDMCGEDSAISAVVGMDNTVLCSYGKTIKGWIIKEGGKLQLSGRMLEENEIKSLSLMQNSEDEIMLLSVQEKSVTFYAHPFLNGRKICIGHFLCKITASWSEQDRNIFALGNSSGFFGVWTLKERHQRS